MTDPETRAIPVDVADLCKRLKRVDCSGDELGGDIGTCSYRNPDGPEAATALETLAAENARLREALEHIANYYGDGHRITELARAALSPVTQVQEPRP